MIRIVLAFFYIAALIHFSHSEVNHDNSVASRMVYQTKEVKEKNKEIDSKEIVCMRDNILHEAGVESEQGKMAVVLVTLNRVKDKHYPNTICKVVKQRNKSVCQFSWVCFKKQSFSKKQNYEAYLLAKKLIKGYNRNMVFDITHGSLLYHADYVKPYWAEDSKLVGKIDSHLFYNR